MPFIFDLDVITPISSTNNGSGNSGGTTNYNHLTNQPSINGVTLIGNKTSENLNLVSKSEITQINNSLDIMDIDISELKDNKIQINTEIDDIKDKLNSLSPSNVTEDFVNLAISNHNSDYQSHIDIKKDIVDLIQSVGKKANTVEITDNKFVGSIAIINSDGQYELSNKKVDDFIEDIDILNQQMGAFVSVSKDSALKSASNTFTADNIFTKDVTFSNTSKINFEEGSYILDNTNQKVLFKPYKINNNTQELYVGSDQLWLKGTDKIVLEGTEIKTKRGTAPDNWVEYVNIDSGNINDYISNTGTSVISNDKHGIMADYATCYGILDCPNGLIYYSPNNKEIEIQPSVVLQMAGSDTKTLIASKTKYEIEETGKVTLFFTKTVSANGTIQLGFVEAGDVFYQEDEPSNGVTSFLAWWQPSKNIWQFKSNYTGNVWRTAIATPIANINANDTGITSVNYIGYRIIDDDIFAQLSDIDSINDTISSINSNINDLQTALDSTININYLNSTEINELDTVDKTIIGSINELEITKADVNQLPQLSQLMNGNAPSIPDFDAEITDIKTVIMLFNAFLAQLRTRGVIS